MMWPSFWFWPGNTEDRILLLKICINHIENNVMKKNKMSKEEELKRLKRILRIYIRGKYFGFICWMAWYDTLLGFCYLMHWPKPRLHEYPTLYANRPNSNVWWFKEGDRTSRIALLKKVIGILEQEIKNKS